MGTVEVDRSGSACIGDQHPRMACQRRHCAHGVGLSVRFLSIDRNSVRDRGFVLQGAGRETHRAWNADKIEAILNKSASVVAVFSGHDHPGGYACVAGKHYIIPEAVLESPEDSNAYGIVRVYADHLVIQGCGVVTSRTCKFKALPVAAM